MFVVQLTSSKPHRFSGCSWGLKVKVFLQFLGKMLKPRLVLGVKLAASMLASLRTWDHHRERCTSDSPSPGEPAVTDS